MSDLEGLAGLFEHIEESVGDEGPADEGGMGDGEASKEVDAEIEKSIQAQVDAFDKEEQADVFEGVTEGRQEAMDAVRNPAAPRTINVGNVWANAKAFGKFVGVEVAKGALMAVGTEIVEKVWKDSGTSSAIATRAVKVLAAVDAAQISVNDVVNDWLNWMGTHYDSRDSYGSIPTTFQSIKVFQILQVQIGDLSNTSDSKVAPLLKTLTTPSNTTDKSLDDLTTAVTAWLAQLAKDASSIEKPPFALMVKEGLTSHVADVSNIQAAFKSAIV